MSSGPDTSGWEKVGDTDNAEFFEVEPGILAIVPHEGCTDDENTARQSVEFQHKHWRDRGRTGSAMIFMDRIRDSAAGARKVYGEPTRPRADPGVRAHRGNRVRARRRVGLHRVVAPRGPDQDVRRHRPRPHLVAAAERGRAVTEGSKPVDPSDADEDPIVDVLMRLARADFDARAPRSYDGSRGDTLAYLVNTVSEELARMVLGLKAHEEKLEHSVRVLSDVLASHAAGDFSARAPRTEDGSPLDVLAFIINNTGAETGRLFDERNRAFEELKQAKETEAINRAKSAFLANVSHELRTPLTLILGPLHAALTNQRDDLPRSTVRELETVLRNAGRLSRMVNDLLDFARAEEKQLQPAWQWTDAARVVEEAAADLQPIARARKLQLGAEVRGTRREVALDRRMFEKIVVNLVGNALKFTPPGGTVRASIEITDDEVALRVSDTGIGIAPEQCERVFDRFHQVDTSQSRQFDGSGLGLALVREFAVAMCGTATVQSVLGEGSTFSVVLPAKAPDTQEVLPADAEGPWSPPSRVADVAMLSEPPEPGATIDASIEPAGGTARPFVLVAEDNADMRRYICDVLTPHFEVRAVADGAEALEATGARPPDVILSDVMMPNMDGFELVRSAKADPQLAPIPIVLLTARAGSDASVEGLDVGADDYLAKPFQPRELIARVRAAARLRATGKQLTQTLDELQVTKSLVLRMGQVDAAGGVLVQVGERMRAALSNNDVQALDALASEIVRLGAPVSAPPEGGGSTSLVAMVRDALSLSSHEGDEARAFYPHPATADSLGRLLDGLAIPTDGSATLRVVDDGVEIVAKAAQVDEAPSITGPLPGRPGLDDLALARAQLALLHCGVESRLSTQDDSLVLRLVPA